MEKEKGLERRAGPDSFSKQSRDRSHVDILLISRGFESDLPVSFSSFPTHTMSQHLWLRCEKKEFERRAALSPEVAKKLIDAGFTIHVERDEQRIFHDSEYESYAHLYPLLIVRR